MDEARVKLLERIATLWRGDWSGHSFDGRDGHHWIMTALHGDAFQLAELDTDLTSQEEYQQ